MSLPPVKPRGTFHFAAGDRLTRSTKAQARFTNNLAKLTGLGILLSVNIRNLSAGAEEMHPVFRSVLERISLQNCRSAQEAVAMINQNLPPILARVEVLPGQQLPKEYLLRKLPEPTPGYQHLLEGILQDRGEK